MTGSHKVVIAGEELWLMPQRAIYWPRRRTLFLADAHWGKLTAFRNAGLALSTDPIHGDLERLNLLLEQTEVLRVVILGDLVHAKASLDTEIVTAVENWCMRWQHLAIELIIGNHDRRAGTLPTSWSFTVHAEPLHDPPFAYRHYPEHTPGAFTLAGHVHPAVMLRGLGRQRLRLPCYLFGEDVGILPAFGGFTGTATLSPTESERVYVIADNEVIPYSSEPRY